MQRQLVRIDISRSDSITVSAEHGQIVVLLTDEDRTMEARLSEREWTRLVVGVARNLGEVTTPADAGAQDL